MTGRAAARWLAHRSGALAAFHRVRQDRCLTVLMFHRVLPAAEMNRWGADPVYTITPDLLAQILVFLEKNYAIVGMKDVVASLARERALPRRPLLITFDDGWRDNLEWGLPVFRGTPWSIFVASDAVSGTEYWWQEVLLWALRTGEVTDSGLWESLKSEGQYKENSGRHVLLMMENFAKLAPGIRAAILSGFEDRLRSLGVARHMLTLVEVAKLRQSGVAIGGHGAAHLPLSRIDDPGGDLRRSTEWLRDAGGLPVMSCPHGRYDKRTLAAAVSLGYSAVFTSDPALTPCPEGWLQSSCIGRIPVEAARVSNRPGVLAEDRLAALLYLARIGENGRA